MSPRPRRSVRVTALTARITSKMRALGMSADTRTGATGQSGKTVRTVVQRVRLGAVSSDAAKS